MKTVRVTMSASRTRRRRGQSETSVVVHTQRGGLGQHDRTVPATTAALTYRSLFAIREFRVLFLNRCVVVISVAASGLALATITYEATRSAVLGGVSMFGGPLVSLVVSQFLLASSDRVRPRTALMGQMGAALVRWPQSGQKRRVPWCSQPIRAGDQES